MAVAPVLFQKWEVGSCVCRGWIASTQYSSGRSPDVCLCVEVGINVNREKAEDGAKGRMTNTLKLHAFIFYCISICLSGTLELPLHSTKQGINSITPAELA